MRLKKPRTATLLLWLAAVLLALTTAELVLRGMGFSYYWALYKQPHPVLGWAPLPGTVARQRFEGDALVRINSAGMRDREHAREKPDGVLRIAVLGDSFTEAVQVPVEQTYWRLLEQELNHTSGCLPEGQWVEVLSFGLSGYSTAQELLLLRERVWDFAPDWVLLAFFHGNDPVESSPQLDKEPMRPYFVLEGDGLRRDDGFRQSSAYRWRSAWYGRLWLAALSHSRLLQAVVRAVDVVRLATRRPEPAAPGLPYEAGVDVRVYQSSAGPEWEQAWRVTEALLSKLHREVAGHGARLVVATPSTGLQVHPDAKLRAWFQEQLGVADLFGPERRIAAVGEREGFPVVTLAPSMQSYAVDEKVFLHGFANALPGAGHWNPRGHWVAARLLGQALCDGILRDGR
jgi:hypothetical protein